MMKNSQSKFSNKKIHSSKEPTSKASSVSGCCCGSKISEEIEETEVETEK